MGFTSKNKPCIKLRIPQRITQEEIGCEINHGTDKYRKSEPIVEGKISPTTTKICAKDHNDDRSKNIE